MAVVDPRDLGWMGAVEIDLAKVRDISADVLDEHGRLKVMPASYWAGTTAVERARFGHEHGCYGFPTIELVDYLKDLIGEDSAIEVGAGNGVLAEALGIRATDNYQQAMEKYALIYKLTGQPTVQYGANVQNMHASSAVRRYKPDVVVGCWVTHKYNPARHDQGGNEIGVDEADVLLNCRRYILIGNEKTHSLNPIWSRKHTIEYPDFVYSRAHNGSRDFVAVFRGAKR